MTCGFRESLLFRIRDWQKAKLHLLLQRHLPTGEISSQPFNAESCRKVLRNSSPCLKAAVSLRRFCEHISAFHPLLPPDASEPPGLFWQSVDRSCSLLDLKLQALAYSMSKDRSLHSPCYGHTHRPHPYGKPFCWEMKCLSIERLHPGALSTERSERDRATFSSISVASLSGNP